jgi:hypothetical protein
LVSLIGSTTRPARAKCAAGVRRCAGRSIALFVAAAIAEIGGAYLVLKPVKEHRSMRLAVVAGSASSPTAIAALLTGRDVRSGSHGERRALPDDYRIALLHESHRLSNPDSPRLLGCTLATANLRPLDAGGRIVADEFSDYLFLHCDEAIENLRNECIPDGRTHFVGNTMIDSLVAVEGRFRSLDSARRLAPEPRGYLPVTLLVDGPLSARGDAAARRGRA